MFVVGVLYCVQFFFEAFFFFQNPSFLSFYFSLLKLFSFYFLSSILLEISKCVISQNIGCLIKTSWKNSTQTISQGVAHEQPWSSIVCLLWGSSIVSRFAWRYICFQNPSLLWNFSGISKGCLWDFYWISIICLSDLYGTSMFFLWYFSGICGISMIFLLDFYDSSTVLLLEFYRIPTAFLWEFQDVSMFFYGITMGCLRELSGNSMGFVCDFFVVPMLCPYLWSFYGSSVRFLWDFYDKSTEHKFKLNWNQLNQLKVNWNQLKSKLKSIESRLNSVESKLKVNWNQLKSIEIN